MWMIICSVQTFLLLWIYYHYVMENGENQHAFVRRSEIAFPSARHSVVK